MFRNVGLLAATGLVGFAALKLVGWLFLPLLGALFGLVMWALKIILIVGLIWFGYHLFKRFFQDRPSEA